MWIIEDRMRVTYRKANNKDYWEKRWFDIPSDAPMENENKYPLKYAKLTVNSHDGKILEAGCGAGRILSYLYYKNYDVVGIDFIESAIKKIKIKYKDINAEVSDISNTNFDDNSFDTILAFGLYHNFEIENQGRENHSLPERIPSRQQ